MNKAEFDLAHFGTVVGQQLRESRAQRSTRSFAKGKQFVEIRSARSLCRARRFRGEQTLRKRRSQVQDFVADGDAASWFTARRAEYAKRKVLNRKLGMAVPSGHPRSPGWRMPGVDCQH